MKTIAVLGMTVVMTFFAVPAGAIEPDADLPVLTLADFQIQYGGTKPVVAFNKYHEYNLLLKTPRTSLGPSRMRTEGVVPTDYARGTKPVVAVIRPTKVWPAGPVGLVPAEKNSLRGTKPSVALRF